MISAVVFGLAVALLIAHVLDGRVPRGYVLAAFIASAIVAAGDIREHTGQTCVTAATTVTATTTDASGQPAAVVQTYPVTTCTVYSTVNVEAVAALVASIAMALLVLAYEILDRLGRAAGGWAV